MRLRIGLTITVCASILAFAGCFQSHTPKDPVGRKGLTPADVAVGMTSQDFGSIFSGVKISANGEWTRPAEIHGLRGHWTYSFYKGKLSWFVFNSYDSTVNANTFRQYLEATQLSFKDYTETLGKPTQLVSGVLEFKNPRDGYPGYPVLTASWQTETENLRIEYSVLSSGREHAQLLFTVEVKR